MLQIELSRLQHEHIEGLIGMPETLRLEFKQELELSTSGHKKEAAKDISAFANSQGGRIIYGIAERKQPDGSRIADAIRPLADHSLKGRLEDIIADSIHPRPHCSLHSVPLENGFVLVVEVYPSLGRDLHMVTTDHRFYRRGETRTILMTEPEIREAYGRLAISLQTLEISLETKVRHQVELTPGDCQSVLIVPWFARRNLADPRILMEIGRDLAENAFQKYRTWDPDYLNSVRNIRTERSGLHAHAKPGREGWDFFVTREGVVHLSDQGVIQEHLPKSNAVQMSSLINNILTALGAARLILDKCNYWGPVHVVQCLRLYSAAQVVYGRAVYGRPLDPDSYEQALPDINLIERGDDLEPIARELCDELFQILGYTTCPLFVEDGHLRDEVRQFLAQS